jgi:hypothetical protein
MGEMPESRAGGRYGGQSGWCARGQCGVRGGLGGGRSTVSLRRGRGSFLLRLAVGRR